MDRNTGRDPAHTAGREPAPVAHTHTDHGQVERRETVREADEPRRIRDYDDRVPAEAVTVGGFRDRVRWGPVVAGLVTALSVFMLLSLLAAGLGLAAAVQADPGQQDAILTTSTIVAALIGLGSFILGGYVAGRTAMVPDENAGAFNGFLVWALGVTLIMAFGAFGLGQLFGAAGAIFGQLQQINVDVEPGTAADALTNSALIAFVALALPAIAAALGGWLGARQTSGEATVARSR